MAFSNGESVDELARHLGKSWAAIQAARNNADTQRSLIGSILHDNRLVPSDTSFVVFGSLARGEWTIGSDVDWTLLVDGQADPNHWKISHATAKCFDDANLNAPGPTAIFGNLGFSHDIVHQIGGESDTNRNTTQRILLLLESRPIGNSDVWERVVMNVLNRYLDSDISLLSRSGQLYKVPRFLLNDIVRYWRTICVDYANKHRQRQGDKWALRNAKLRLSRKLIFASGMLICFNCYLKPPPGLQNLFDIPDHLGPLLSYLRDQVLLTPLDILADAVRSFARPETAAQIFDAYDRFLTLMNDSEFRKHLGALKLSDANSDPCFNEIREISNRFQDGLTRLFFDDDKKLAELTRKYGIF